MAFSMKDDTANFELSIEQLDGVAGGGWFGDVVHWVEHQLKSIFTNPLAAKIGGGIILAGALLSGGGASHKMN